MKLLLIRHGEPDTEHGPAPDPPLSALGRAQAESLGAWLAGEPLAAVYTSPLLRARETAGFLPAPAVLLEGLAEVGGAGEYVAADVMKRNGDPRYAALISGDLAVYGTDVATFRATVVAAIDGIVERHPGETVAVVSHAGVINAYLGAHLGIERRMIWSALDYASVTRVIANRVGARTISALNERAHSCGRPARTRGPGGVPPTKAACAARKERAMAGWILNDTPSKVFPLYSRANVGEVFPDPISPLNATTGFLANLEPGWKAAYVACGVWDDDIYDTAVEHNPIACFDGYLFINMSLMRLFGVRVPGFSPEAVDFQYFGDMPGIPSYESEARPFDESEEWSGRAGAWLVGDVLGATDLASLDAERAEVLAEIAARPDLASLSSADLAARITQWNTMFQRLFQTHIEVSLKAGIGLGAVAQACGAMGVPELSLTLVAGIGDVDSAAASLQMWTLGRMVAGSSRLMAEFDAGPDGLADRLRAAAGARDNDPDVVAFCAALDRFLDDWAFRGPNEWELRCPTWGTDPAIALAALDRVRLADPDSTPSAASERGAAARLAAAAQLRGALAGNDEVLGQLNAALNAAELWCRGRERQRTTVAMLVHEQRLAALELARRGVAAGVIERPEQIFMLLADELADYVAALDGGGGGDQAKLGAVLADREERYLALFDYEPPFVIAGGPPPLAEWARRSLATAAPTLAAGESIQGVGGCPGVVRGTARVVLDPSDPSQLGPGDVLVAPITDPSWTPLFLPAAAVVVEVGSPFSHAAIVSRELGIPCVVSAGAATQRIPDGATVEVDGTAGTVTLIG